MNNKGFMMAEVVVVSSIIMVFLTGLYMSYNKLFTIYKERSTYYDVNTLYRLASIVDENNTDGDLYHKDDVTTPIINNNGELVFIIKNADLNKLNDIHETYKDYLNFLTESVDFKSEVIAVMEKCNLSDEDKCTYAYMDIFSS